MLLHVLAALPEWLWKWALRQLGISEDDFVELFNPLTDREEA